MAWDTMFNTIRTRFKTEVADALSLTTQYDNQSLDNPDNTNWCRLTIVPGETQQKSIGSPDTQRERTVGAMIAQLFAPLSAGDGTILDIANSIRTAFKRVTVSGITFQTPYLVRVGQKKDSWQINVVCPFYGDDIG